MLTSSFADMMRMLQYGQQYQIYIASIEQPVFTWIEGIQEDVELPCTILQTREQQGYVVLETDRHRFVLFTFPHCYQVLLNVYTYAFQHEPEIIVLRQYMYPYYAARAMERQQYKLQALIESTTQITSMLNPEEIFDNVLSHALDVISNCEIGTLWWYDETQQRLTCKASLGNILKGIQSMQFLSGEGPIGETFQSGKPILYTHLQPPTAMRMITAENEQYWDDDYIFLERVKSFISCPIDINGKTVGVFFLCQLHKPILLNETDLFMLQGFSSLIGIAIRNAQQYSAIQQLNEHLVKRDELQRVLSELSMQNRGIEPIIMQMGQLMKRELLFVDLLENDIVPAMHRLPNGLSFADLADILHRLETPYYELKRAGIVTHVMYPIRAGAMIIGCICIEGAQKLSLLDQLIIETGHAILALELSRKQHISDYYYKQKRELFISLITTQHRQQRDELALQLGIQTHIPFRICIIQLQDEGNPYETEAATYKLAALCKRQLFAYTQLLFTDHHMIVMLMKSTPYEDKMVQRELHHLFTDWHRTAQQPLYCGISSIYEGMHTIQKAHQEATVAVDYLEGRKEASIIEYKQIGVNRLFMQHNSEDLVQFVREVFEPLRTPIAEKSNLEQTLVTYIAQNRSAAKTASVMHIHINTLYQRLAKIEELLDVHFDDYEQMLRLQLACYLKESYTK